MKSKNKFVVNGDTITITKSDWTEPALATYKSDYYDELTSHTWGLKNGYPNNDKLGGGLHRYMMKQWYGLEVLKEMTEKGFVVDHMNNNPMDCRIQNLEFLKKNRNVSKGQYFDYEAKRLRTCIAVSMYKDFENSQYQITIGFNDYVIDKDGRSVQTIKLLYDEPYSMVILDAENIITQYSDTEQIHFSNMSFKDIKVTYSPEFELTDAEKNRP